MNIDKYMELLGHRAEDKVTGMKGVITSLNFDLYGCIQVTLNPGMDKEGKMRDSLWFDVARMKITSSKPVMDVPDFGEKEPEKYDKGPAERPKFMKN